MMRTLYAAYWVCLLVNTALAVAPFDDGVVVGYLNDAEINEASGLAASRVHPNILYTINDSGGAPRVYAISSTSASLVARLDIGDGARNCDWEDIALGTGPGGASYIYIGDVGGNAGENCRTIYRVQEPDVMEDQTLSVQAVARYNWLEFDCETVMVDPSGKTFLVTKVSRGETATVYEVPDNAWGSADPAELTGGTHLNAYHNSNGPVGGDINPQGSEILIKMYNRIFYWSKDPGEPVQSALQRAGDTVRYNSEPQGESVNFSYDSAQNGFFTISEGVGQPLIFYRRNNVEKNSVDVNVTGRADNVRSNIIPFLLSFVSILFIKLMQ